MANDRSSPLVRELGLLLGGGTTAGLSDRELLDRFVARRGESAEAAFSALVHRHGPMVRDVCRRLLRDPADAGDAFQATFLVLVHRANTVRVGPSLAPWLYGVSVRVARRARSVAARRKGRERTNAELPEPAANDPGPADDLRGVFDEELRSLPARYRAALVLCYLEGLTHDEAARQLGCPIGTVRSRLARGRDLLRTRLVRRGLAPSASAVLPRPTRAAVPEELFTSTARAALRLAAGQPLAGTVPAGISVLVAGVSRIMTLQKLAVAASFLVAAVVGAAGLAALAAQEPKPQASNGLPRTSGKEEPAERPASPAKKADEEASLKLTGPPRDDAFDAFPPVVFRTVPPVGSTDVDPGLSEIRVTFSKEMQNSVLVSLQPNSVRKNITVGWVER